MLTAIFLTFVVIYALGAVGTFAIHVIFLQMVTLELAALRAAFWPICFAIGWPRGTPLPMD